MRVGDRLRAIMRRVPANRFLSMRWWLAGAFALVAALTALAVVTVLNDRSEAAFRKYAEDFALGVSVSSAETLNNARTDTQLSRAASVIAANRRISVFVVGDDGRLLTPAVSNDVRWSAVPDGPKAVRAVQSGSRYIHGTRDGSALVIGLRLRHTSNRVVVVYALRPELRTQLGIVRNEFVSSALIAFLVGAAAGLSIAILTSRRLAKIAGAARRIGHGELSQPVVVDRFPDEVGSLAASIDQMRRQLQESFSVLRADRQRLRKQERTQREFATNAAHELRTPLASIVTAVEMLQTGAKDDPAALDDFLELIEHEAARLTRLTQALLALARAEAYEESPLIGEFRVRPVLDGVARGLSPAPAVRVTVDCDPALEALGEPILLEQAIASLAANAVEHTGEGSVTLAAVPDATAVSITVADTGTGIPAGEQERIFDRFYQANGAGAGFGLGLSIARDTVRVLGGEIHLVSGPGQGTTVEIRLPLATRVRA